jgi:hypothetical protein
VVGSQPYRDTWDAGINSDEEIVHETKDPVIISGASTSDLNDLPRAILARHANCLIVGFAVVISVMASCGTTSDQPDKKVLRLEDLRAAEPGTIEAGIASQPQRSWTWPPLGSGACTMHNFRVTLKSDGTGTFQGMVRSKDSNDDWDFVMDFRRGDGERLFWQPAPIVDPAGTSTWPTHFSCHIEGNDTDYSCTSTTRFGSRPTCTRAPRRLFPGYAVNPDPLTPRCAPFRIDPYRGWIGVHENHPGKVPIENVVVESMERPPENWQGNRF